MYIVSGTENNKNSVVADPYTGPTLHFDADSVRILSQVLNNMENQKSLFLYGIFNHRNASSIFLVGTILVS